MKVIFEHQSHPSGLGFLVKEYVQTYFTSPFHFHDLYELILIRKSHGKLYAGRKIMNFQDGDIFLFGPGFGHCFYNERSFIASGEMAQAVAVFFRVSKAGGSGALAGSANFRTLGVEDVIRAGQDSGVLASATWGSNGIGWSEMVAAGTRTDTAGVAIALSHRDQGLYKNGAGQTVPFGDQDLLSGLAKVYIKPAPGVRVDFGGVFYDNNFTSNSYEQDLKSKILTSKFA